MSELSETCVAILKHYADENGTIVRSTSDLSPLESWLLCHLSGMLLLIDNLYEAKKKVT
jgi:hypothetical protein